MHKVFVYGTLKRGYRNHHYVEDSTFLGVTQTLEAHWDMVDVPSKEFTGKSCPSVLKNGAYHITGEVYDVDDKTLEKLDQLEDYKIYYDREVVLLSNGMKAYMYFNIDPDINWIPPNPNLIVNNQQNTITWIDEKLY